MKKQLFATAVIALLTLTGCKDKAENATFKDDVVSEPRLEELIPEPDAPQEGDTISVSGVVTEIVSGKDGYMAKIKRNEHHYYTITVSVVNLKDPKQFKRAEVGQNINATGEVFMLDGDIGVKATSFEIIK